MRRNVLDWLTETGTNAHHVVILTHNIDFFFVQSILDSKLYAVGSPKITIFADAMSAAASFEDQSALLGGLGTRYRVVPVDLGPYRRFHPKALLLASAQRAALAIGSGNLTHGGMAANHEAWTFAASDGESPALIAAFRDYLYRLVPTLPLAGALVDELDSIFDQEQAWAVGLPEPGGLAATPSDISLLNQMTQLVDGAPDAVSVLAPYHDDRAAALTELATRFDTPLTCWMQPGHEGLSQSVASGLPANVTLRAIDCEPERRPSFIHAKVLAFHKGDSVSRAIGSANCSQAALLANASWGNAELMAVGTVSAADAEGFFSDLVRGDVIEELPEHPPSDEWEAPARHSLRVLAARQEGDRLSVAYDAPGRLSDISIEADVGSWSASESEDQATTAIFFPGQRLRNIVLKAKGPEGELWQSPLAWVDDESRLSTPSSFRRVLQRMESANATGANKEQAFQDVLALFAEYLRDPRAAKRTLKRIGADAANPLQPYDPAAVFADDFGHSGISALGWQSSIHAPTSVLAIIQALFKDNPEISGRFIPSEDAVIESEEDTLTPESEQAALLSDDAPKPKEKISLQLTRALEAVDQALCDPKFVAVRSPALLGNDLALAAVLLVKGLADRLLDTATFRNFTRRIWASLFFERDGIKGTLIERVHQVPEGAERHAFITALVQPRLAAALALWSTIEWNATDSDGEKFRFSAILLHASHPWLLASAPTEVIAAEIQKIASSILPVGERPKTLDTWRELIKAGTALSLLKTSLSTEDAARLRAAAKAPQIAPRELLWVNDRFAFANAAYARMPRVKAHIQMVGHTNVAPYMAQYLVPVRELVDSDVLTFPSGAKSEIVNLIDFMTSQS